MAKKVINTTATNKNLSIRNHSNINFSARTIARDFNYGSATVNRLITVFNDLRYEQDIRNLSQISQDTIQQYMEQLHDQVMDGSLSPKTVVNYISTVNAIVRYIDKPDLATVSAKELGISKGSEIATADRSVSSASHQVFLERLQSHTAEDIRYKALEKSVQLQRELGLRARESFAVKDQTIKNALSTGVLHLSKPDMTKSYRPRSITISQDQKHLLQETLSFMRENRWHSLIHPDQTLKEHSGWAYRQVLNFQKSASSNKDYHFHAERHFYAHRRFEELWQEKSGIALKPPVKISGDWKAYASAETGMRAEKIKEIDTEVRTVVSQELGHNRLSITRVYLG